MAKQEIQDQNPENTNDDGGEINSNQSANQESTTEKTVPDKPTQLFEGDRNSDLRESLSEEFEKRENFTEESEETKKDDDLPSDEQSNSDDQSGSEDKKEVHTVKSMGGEKQFTTEELIKIAEQHEGLENFNEKLQSIKDELKQTREELAQVKKPPEEEPTEETSKPADLKDLGRRISTGTDEEAAKALEEFREEIKRELTEGEDKETLTAEEVDRRTEARIKQYEMVQDAEVKADAVMNEFLTRDDKKNMDLFENDETSKIFTEETANAVVEELKKLKMTDQSLQGFNAKQLVEGHQLNFHNHPDGKTMRPLDELFEAAGEKARKRIETITGRPAVQTKSNVSDKKSEKENISTQPDRQSSPPPKPEESSQPKTEQEIIAEQRKEAIEERQAGWRSQQ